MHLINVSSTAEEVAEEIRMGTGMDRRGTIDDRARECPSETCDTGCGWRKGEPTEKERRDMFLNDFRDASFVLVLLFNATMSSSIPYFDTSFAAHAVAISAVDRSMVFQLDRRGG